MGVWWAVWAFGVALPVVAVLLQLRERPRERWRFPGGTAPWHTYVFATVALASLIISTRQLSGFAESYEFVGLGGALVALAIVGLIGWRHNTRLESSR